MGVEPNDLSDFFDQPGEHGARIAKRAGGGKRADASAGKNPPAKRKIGITTEGAKVDAGAPVDYRIGTTRARVLRVSPGYFFQRFGGIIVASEKL
jgi:hypothetical protein